MMKTVRINNHQIGPNLPVFIVAEIGGNFTTYEEAVGLISTAKGCGVDAVKLQTLRAQTITTRKAIFDMENTGRVPQYDLFLKYELDLEMHRRIFDYAASIGMIIFSTPSYFDDVDLLETIGVPVFKIGSDDAYNLPFLDYVARKRKPIILSTGMCTLSE